MEKLFNSRTQWTIMFISRVREEFNFQLAMADKLKNYGLEVLFLTMQKNTNLRNGKISVIEVPKMLNKLKQDLRKLKRDELDKQIEYIEERYNGRDFRRLIEAHKGAYNIRKINEKESIITILSYFKLLEKITNERKIDFIFGGEGGELLRTIALKVAHKKGIKCAIDFCMPLPKMTCLVHDPINIESEFEQSQNRGIIDHGEKEKISEFIDDIRRSKRDFVNLQRTVIKKRHFKKFFVSLWGKYILKDPNYSEVSILGRIKELLKRQVNKFIFRLLYRMPREERFLFYPVHAQNDSQLTLRAPQFHLNQEYLIEQIAKSLPFEYKLYVKEHPAEIGGCSFWKMYFLLKKYPNIRMIHPYVHPHFLIKNCQAVITINSTTGFESIIFKKPTIALGKSFYWKKGLTVDVENLYELPGKIEEALQVVISDEKIINLIYEIKTRCSNGFCMCLDYSKRNALQIAESLVEYLNLKK